MNLTRLFTLAIVVGTLVCTSCQSSKVAYGNSYYFKATPRETTPAPTSSPAPDLYASTAPTPIPAKSLPQDDFSVAAPPSSLPVHQTEEQATTRQEARQTRRAQRKATRTQLKQWLKKAPVTLKEQVKQQVDGFTRIGIIVGAAGLVMLLVSLLGSNGFLVGIGGILLGIGVVFILIDIL